MNQTCIISLQINRFLYYPASFVGHRCQTTRAVIDKVATTYHEDYWDWQYGQHHQRYTDYHSPCWIAVELFRSLSNSREKLLIHLYLKRANLQSSPRPAVFKHVLIFLSPCTHDVGTTTDLKFQQSSRCRIAISLPVGRTKTVSHSF